MAIFLKDSTLESLTAPTEPPVQPRPQLGTGIDPYGPALNGAPQEYGPVGMAGPYTPPPDPGPFNPNAYDEPFQPGGDYGGGQIVPESRPGQTGEALGRAAGGFANLLNGPGFFNTGAGIAAGLGADVDPYAGTHFNERLRAPENGLPGEIASRAFEIGGSPAGWIGVGPKALAGIAAGGPIARRLAQEAGAPDWAQGLADVAGSVVGPAALEGGVRALSGVTNGRVPGMMGLEEFKPPMPTEAEVKALQDKIVREGKTPENMAQLDDLMGRLFQTDRNPYQGAQEAAPSNPVVGANLDRLTNPGRLEEQGQTVTDALAAAREPVAQKTQQQLQTELYTANQDLQFARRNRRTDLEEAAKERLQAASAEMHDLYPPPTAPNARPYVRPETPEAPSAPPYVSGAERKAADVSFLDRVIEDTGGFNGEPPTGGMVLQGRMLPLSPSSAIGAVTGFVGGGQVGDTPEEKVRNSLIGAAGGAVAGPLVNRGISGLAKAIEARRGALAVPSANPRTTQQTINEVLAAPLSALSTYDVSGPGRQLFRTLLAHPTAIPRVFKAQFNALKSEAEFQASQEALATRPWAALRERMGVEMADVSTDMAKREEQIQSSMVERLLPGSRAFNRAYTGAVNEQRDFLTKFMLDRIPPESYAEGVDGGDERLQQAGRLINAATGRGNLGQAFKDSNVLGQPLFWAVRQRVGNVQVPLSALFSTSPEVRIEAARQVGALTAFQMALFGVGKATGAWDVELDPRSSDWGQVRIGDRRFDFTAGTRPLVNVMARLGITAANDLYGTDIPNAKGINSSQGTGRLGTRKAIDVAGNYIRGSLAPTLGEVWNQVEGKDVVGNKLPDTAVGRAMHAAQGLGAALFLQQLAEEMAYTVPKGLKDGGVGGALSEAGKSIAAGGLYAQGVGGSLYQPRAEETNGPLGARTSAWQALSEQAPPELQASFNGKHSYSDWYQGRVSELTPQVAAEARAKGIPEAAVDGVVQGVITRDPVYKAYHKAVDHFETEWIKANPQEALKEWNRQAALGYKDQTWLPTKPQQALIIELTKAKP